MLYGPGDAIATRISHRITAADLGAVMDRLDPATAAHRTVHVFVGTRGIDGVGVAGLAP